MGLIAQIELWDWHRRAGPNDITIKCNSTPDIPLASVQYPVFELVIDTVRVKHPIAYESWTSGTRAHTQRARHRVSRTP